MKLSGKSVLVTGGAGFVGSHIVDRLIEVGCRRIVVVDNLVRGSRENLAEAMDRGSVKLVNADIREQPLMRELVRSADVVFHQAALRITHCAAEPQLAFDVMVRATFDLAQMCVEHDVQKLIVASSASIYGMAAHFPTAEQEPPYSNRTLYGGAKLFAETLLRALYEMHGLDYVALRYFNVYGPRMDRHGKYTEVLIRWMDRIEAGRPPIIFGDGDETMDMVNVRDVARANILAASASATDVALNVASGEEISLRELALRLGRVMGRPDLVPEHRPRRDVNPVPRRIADLAAARASLGFSPAIGLDDGLDELVGWWRGQRLRDDALTPDQALR